MSTVESAVSRHYGGEGLLGRIYRGLEEAGLDRNALRPEDLSPVDEFHIGGRPATEHLVTKLGLKKDHHVLDVGCGIGGASRYMATHSGARVTGIDLTPAYIETAKALTALTGQAEQVDFQLASALDMPFADEAFDGAITIHVAMNISDRAGLYGEIARVLKPGAPLCLFDVMKNNDQALKYPVPWAQSGETSHLTTLETTASLLREAGFSVEEAEDRTEIALEFFRQSRAAGADGPPPLGTHLVMGASAPEKFKNVRDNIESGCIAPVQMVARNR